MVFWAFFAIHTLIVGLWVIGAPPMSSVDEPSHGIKAAAVVRDSDAVPITRSRWAR